MKKILFSYCLLVTALGMAGAGDIAGGGSQKSWSQIFNDRYLYIEAPTVKFAGTQVPITKTCTPDYGVSLRTKNKIWISPSDRDTNSYFRNIDANKKVYLQTDIEYTNEICVGGGEQCTFIKVREKYPLNLEIDIYQSSTVNDNMYGRFLFKKPYEVPNCND